MSLSGNLGFVSLDEVLRLLSRSKQRGAVDVRGVNTRGRIFVDRGFVVLATMLTDEQLRQHLAKSGLTDVEDPAVTTLLREMTVETIYMLGLHGESFEVIEDEASPHPNPTPFELEELLVDARQRLSDWAEVSGVVTDLDAVIRLRRDLGERDRVTIEKDSWRLLSEMGHGASVRMLAEELGTTEFWTARVAAGMIEEGLFALEPTEATGSPAPVWEEPAPARVEPVSREETTDSSPVVTEDQPIYPSAEEGDDRGQVFEEPAEETHSPIASDDAQTESTRQPDPDQSWWSEPEREPVAEDDDSTDEVEEDTEAFLEKVFSELEPTEPTDEGFGLLRRRRMGALRDFSNDA